MKYFAVHVRSLILFLGTAPARCIQSTHLFLWISWVNHKVSVSAWNSKPLYESVPLLLSRCLIAYARILMTVRKTDVFSLSSNQFCRSSTFYLLLECFPSLLLSRKMVCEAKNNPFRLAAVFSCLETSNKTPSLVHVICCPWELLYHSREWGVILSTENSTMFLDSELNNDAGTSR